MSADDARQAARAAQSSAWMHALARGGYAANGLVHLLIGALVMSLAVGGRGEADQSGALRAIADAPWGFVVLWVIAILLGALAAYHLIEGFVLRSGVNARAEAKIWGRRLSAWGQAVIFGGLALLAASVALGARISGDESVEGASRGILSAPGGPLALAACGVAILAGGVTFTVIGVRRGFEKKMHIPDGRIGALVTGLGIAGYSAKGLALAVVGILLIVSAAQTDATLAGGLDAAFDAVRALAFGPILVAAIGLGFLAYGVFLFFRARYARL